MLGTSDKIRDSRKTIRTSDRSPVPVHRLSEYVSADLSSFYGWSPSSGGTKKGFL